MSHRGAAVPEREGGRGRKPGPKREDFRPKEKGAAPRDRPFLCPVCPNGSESDAETDREGVEISEIIDELVAIFGLGIGVGAQLVLIADARIGIVDVGEGVTAGDIGLAGRSDLGADPRSEEHTSELQSLMRRSYAVFCLKKINKLYNS